MSAAASNDSALRILLVADPHGSAAATVAAIGRRLSELPEALPADDGLAPDLFEVDRAPVTFETDLAHPRALALIDRALAARYAVTMVLVGVADRPPAHPPSLLVAAAARASVTLCYRDAGLPAEPVLQLNAGRVTPKASTAPPWLSAELLLPLQRRADQLQRVKAFALANDLVLQPAVTHDIAYEGRMQVQTEDFITQNIGARTLVLHDKAFVGRDLHPGQSLRIDYAEYSPRDPVVAVSHYRPPKVAR